MSCLDAKAARLYGFLHRRDGRVAEGGGLLNRYTLSRRIEGSNPSLSARPPLLRYCAKWYPTPSGVAPDARDQRRGIGNLSEFVFREVSHENWPDFAGLFESRGGPKSCWCMVWRSTATEAKQRDGVSRRAAMQSKVEA